MIDLLIPEHITSSYEKQSTWPALQKIDIKVVGIRVTWPFCQIHLRVCARASGVMCLGLGVGGSGPSLAAAAAALCDQIKIARRFPSRTRPFVHSFACCHFNLNNLLADFWPISLPHKRDAHIKIYKRRSHFTRPGKMEPADRMPERQVREGN